MTARCRDCRHPLKSPSPDGFGPVCRRRHQPPSRYATGPPAAVAGRLDHAALEDAGQTTIPVQPELPDTRRTP